MRTPTALILASIFLLAACNSGPHVVPAPARLYHGAASVGDFLTIAVDSTAKMIAYLDMSNGTSGTVAYTVNPDGAYTLSDPSGNLVAAYEVPNYVLLIQAAKAGPNANTPALITAVGSREMSLAMFEGQAYNFMQFRAAARGMDVGSLSIGTQGAGSISSFHPYGSYNQGNREDSFSSGTLDLSAAQLDPSATFLQVPDVDAFGYDYAFGTANGIFALGVDNSSILAMKKAASKNLDPSAAGTYQAIYYQKTGASTGLSNVEMGMPSLGKATLFVTRGGQVTVTDAQGNWMAQGLLVPVADASYLYGSSGQLADPCYGLFTFRVTAPTAQQDVFVTFVDHAMLFSSFTASLPWSFGATYNYFYGVGLRGTT